MFRIFTKLIEHTAQYILIFKLSNKISIFFKIYITGRLLIFKFLNYFYDS